MSNACFILCRKRNCRTEKLKEDLSKDIDTFLICDNEISTNTMVLNNFVGFNHINFIKNRPSAWEKSFFYLETKVFFNKYDHIYFIEDDVYSKNNSMYIALIKYWNTLNEHFISKHIRSKNQSLEWFWWENDISYKKYFKNPYRSFNPVCRLSSKLIDLILKFRKKNSGFIFHEILFSSIAIKKNMKYIDYSLDKKSQKYIGNIDYRPIIISSSILDNRLYHPVKEYLS
jgi:hypothetical protein